MHPAKAVEQNEMPFGKDTHVVPSNIVLYRCPGPPPEGEIWGSEPPVHSNAIYCQIILVLRLFFVVKFLSSLPFSEDDHARPLMMPQQSEDQPSLLGNAREPPHLEGVIHVTGQMMATGVKDVAVRAPDGSMGQIDSVRDDQLGQHGIAPGFENMQAPVPANENANQVANGGQDNGGDESQKDYGPAGQREADAVRRVNQKEFDEKDRDRAAGVGEYSDNKDTVNNAQQPLEVRTQYKFTSIQ